MIICSYLCYNYDFDAVFSVLWFTSQKIESCVKNWNLIYEFWVLHCPDADQVHNLSAYVSDYCLFKWSQYPELEIIHLVPEDAFNTLQWQELILKFVEIGKVLLTWATLKNVDMVSKFEI